MSYLIMRAVARSIKVSNGRLSFELFNFAITCFPMQYFLSSFACWGSVLTAPAIFNHNEPLLLGTKYHGNLDLSIKISLVSVTAYRAFQLPSYLNRGVIKPPAMTKVTPDNDAATVMLPITWLKNIVKQVTSFSVHKSKHVNPMHWFVLILLPKQMHTQSKKAHVILLTWV